MLAKQVMVVEFLLEVGEEVKVVVAQQLKHKIISLWLHIWLKRVARKYPDFFMKMIEDICEDDKAKEVMRLRYIYKMKFKAIPQYVGTEERNVYNLHSKIIHKIITL